MECCVTELKNKEVINICDGKRFGYVCDIQVDTVSGKVIAIIVPDECKCFGLVRGNDIIIPWNKIERIGDDIILVNIAPTEPCVEMTSTEKHKHNIFNF